MKTTRILHRFFGIALAAALALPLSALAYGPTVPDGFPDVDPGKTLVGVQTADVNSSVLSYSVPLYVTLAVTNQHGAGTVLAPDDYRMINNSVKADNTLAPIGVTGIAVEGIPGRTWKLTPNPTQTGEISLSLGGVPLPEMGTAGTPTVDAKLKTAVNAFYSPTTATYAAIAAKPGTNIPIIGKLMPGFVVTTDVSTVPQFRIHYTVSFLNEAGKPIGAFVEGPEKPAAATP